MESDRAPSPSGGGEVFQPVLPGARDAVDEDDWLALADLRVVDRGAGKLDLVQMPSPIDRRPGWVGIAVVVRHIPYVRVWESRESAAVAGGPRESRAAARTAPRPRSPPAVSRSGPPVGRARSSSGGGAGPALGAPWWPPSCGRRSCRRRSERRTRGRSSRLPCRLGRRSG